MKKRTVIKQKPKTILVATLAIILFAFSFIFVSSNLNINEKKEELILNYNTAAKVDYVVNLKDNNYFSEKTIKSGEQYITSIIDNVEIDYNYNFSSAKKLDAEYSYKIIATVSANYKVDSSTSKKVWSKDYILKESENFKVNDESNISIEEKVNVSYDEYNKIINDFKRDYMLSVVSKVDVYMYVTMKGIYDKTSFVEDGTLLTSIPLSEQTISIATDYKEMKDGILTKEISVPRFNNVILFILGIIFGLLGIVIIVKQVMKILEDDRKQSTYIKKLKKYMHDYSDIIATVKSKPNTKDLKLIEFVKFEELVNAQDDLRVPIIFCETKKNEEGYFFLLSQDCAYYYILKEDD